MKKFLVASILGLTVLDSSPVSAQGHIQLYNYNAANLITYGPYSGPPVGDPVVGYSVEMYYFVGDIAAAVNAAFIPGFGADDMPMIMIRATGSGATAVLGANGFPAGMYGSSETFLVPGASVGSVVTIVVVASDSYPYAAAFIRGHSQAFTMIAGTSTSAPQTGDYMNGFQVVTSLPEPTSFTLVGLGLGVLAFWRRRTR
jgi:hypothetical protein